MDDESSIIPPPPSPAKNQSLDSMRHPIHIHPPPANNIPMLLPRPTRYTVLILCNALLLPYSYLLGCQSAQQASSAEQQSKPSSALRKVRTSSLEAGAAQQRDQVGSALLSTLEASSAEPSSSVAVNQQPSNALPNVSGLDMDQCRGLFVTQGQGGVGEMSMERITSFCDSTTVCKELQDFTGLSDDEFMERMMRRGRFHFEGEHSFWNPESASELAWYYATSIDYLFANAMHLAVNGVVEYIAKEEYEPVLDYSGGVGSYVLALAQRGIHANYFGIGMAEYHFAQYRIMKHGLEDLVNFTKPYSKKTGFLFDPINGPLPQDGSFGSILAMDVLEHIPNYHLVVHAMVKSLRVGGVIIEATPFSKEPVASDKEDIRVHLYTSLPMDEAMGPSMKRVGCKSCGRGNIVWKKTA